MMRIESKERSQRNESEIEKLMEWSNANNSPYGDCLGCRYWNDKHPSHPKLMSGQPCIQCNLDTTNPWFTKCYPNCRNPSLRYSRRKRNRK